ncbi:MAG: hypothetical protein AB7G11_12795 [Phycisphaerales bacterium]
MRERGALLLEVMLSLALFVAAGGTVLAVVSQGVGSIRAARERLHALDLARSAMAEIEAGIATVETLNGPAPEWTDPDAEVPDDTRESGWELIIETTPTEFDGLTLVSITAARSGGSGIDSSAYTLRQLVRLRDAAPDSVGDVDDVTRAAERGARGRAPARTRGDQNGEGER